MIIRPIVIILLLRSLPNFLWPVKKLIIKKSLSKTGKNFRFGSNSIFSDYSLITIGDNVFIGDYSVINTVVPVSIGNNVMFGPEVMIIGGDHNFSVVGKNMKDVKTGGVNLPIVVEDDVWVGSRAIILKGVIIGEGSVVGAGALVTKSLPPYSVCMGSPCNPVKCRFSLEDLIKHLSLVNSKYRLDDIKEAYSKWGITLQ